jgi:hypothetical protein
MRRNRDINMVESMLHLATAFSSQSSVGMRGLSVLPAQKCSVDNVHAEACLSHDWIALSADSLSVGLMFAFEDGDQDEFITIPTSSITHVAYDNVTASQSGNCKVRSVPSLNWSLKLIGLQLM